MEQGGKEEETPSEPVISAKNDTDVKIKKKPRVLEDSPDEECSEPTKMASEQQDDAGKAVKEQEAKARQQLMDFLTKHNIDPKLADDFQVHIRKSKAKSKNVEVGSPGGVAYTYSVSFSGPDGSILASKSDVLSAIQDRINRRHSSSSRPSLGTRVFCSREDAYENAKYRLEEKLNSSEETFPMKISENVEVLSLGNIDLREGFHSSVQLYPVGYRCKKVITGLTYFKGFPSQTIICEIVESDGFPEFRIVIPGTGTTHWASSEAMAWKKYNPSQVDPEWSFFNLEIELLLEGLPNAIKCEEYQFHEERGYGVTYSTQEESLEMKNNFLAKLSREKRNLDRQRNRHVSKEDQARQVELNRRKDEEEKEMNKKLQAMEKEKREKLKIENKKQREEETEAKKKEREDKRKLEMKEKENMKDRQKKIVAYKKEILTEVKRHRALATQAVLEYFDTEESLMDGSAAALSELNDISSLAYLLPTGTAQEILQAPDLDTFFASLPTLPSLVDAPEGRKRTIAVSVEAVEEDKEQQDNAATDTAMVTEDDDKPLHYNGPNNSEMWDAIFDITMTINLLRHTLNIDHNMSPATVLSAVSNKEQADEVCAVLTKLQGEKVKSLPVDPEAEFDRLTLNMTRPLMPALHSLMDLDQKDVESTGRKDKRLAAVRYPLNSLTFLELLRMNILHFLGSQPLRSEEDIRTREDIQHLIRGSKAASYRIAKNIVRNIRYKWHVRSVILDDPTFNKCVKRRREIVVKLLHMRGSNVIEDQLRFYADLNRAEAEACGDDHLEEIMMVLQEEKVGESPEALVQHRKQLRPSTNDFNTEQELLDGLISLCSDPSYPPIYARLACVLIKIINTTAAKNLIWEVDQELYTDYYSTILRPIMLTNVASNLVNRAYDEGASANNSSTSDTRRTPYDIYVSREFYADVRQVCINVLVYNSEVSPICAQAQRLLQVLHRHMVCWVDGVLRSENHESDSLNVAMIPPPLELCQDKYCLFTYTPIQPADLIKCGKCQGCFNLHALEDTYPSPDHRADAPTPLPAFVTPSYLQQYEPLYLPPSAEQVQQVNEEWYCMLCMQDDPVIMGCEVMGEGYGQGDENVHVEGSVWYVNEYGPSASLPWLFNPKYSSVPRKINHDMPYLGDHLNSLALLSSSQFDPLNLSLPHRTILLHSLTELIKDSPAAKQVLGRLHNQGERLLEMCNKSSFREADFLGLVRGVAGEEGVKVAKGLLDSLKGGEASASDGEGIPLFQEGRCVVCHTSTYEEDLQDQDEGMATVLLCDACNAEAHMKCLSIAEVPSDEWYCPSCSDRRKAANKGANASLEGEVVFNIDGARHKAAEEALILLCAEAKAKGLDPFRQNKGEVSVGTSGDGDGGVIEVGGEKDGGLHEEARCMYCGFSERELCCALVVGMSRAEHQAYLSAATQPTVPSTYLNPSSQSAPPGKVNFLFEGEKVEVGLGGPTLPYFPKVGYKYGKTMTKAYERVDGDGAGDGVVVHDYCAAQMFSARVNRYKHVMRRRRRMVGLKVVSMSGLDLLPLGYDRRGREYLTFPFDRGVVYVKMPGNNGDSIRAMGYEAKEKAEFMEMLRRDNGQHALIEPLSVGTCTKESTLNHSPGYVRIDDIEVVKKIAACLSMDGGEAELKKNLLSEVIAVYKDKNNNKDKLKDVEKGEGDAVSMDVGEAEEYGKDDEEDVEDGENGEEEGQTEDEDVMDMSEDEPDQDDEESNHNRVSRATSQVPKTAATQTPTHVKLFMNKGVGIPSTFIIPEEKVFVDVDAEDVNQDAESDPYLSYSRNRYYALGLVNSDGEIIKVYAGGKSKASKHADVPCAYTVTSQIFLEGGSSYSSNSSSAHALSSADLSIPWTDHLFYFSSVMFKRTGRYVLVFTVTSNDPAIIISVPPLVYRVNVTAQKFRCGLYDSLSGAQAKQHIHAAQRHVGYGDRSGAVRREMMAYIHGYENNGKATGNHKGEGGIGVLKCLLFSIYLALPVGALQIESTSASSKIALPSALLEQGWNETLESIWVDTLLHTRTLTGVAECMCMLEQHLPKSHLPPPLGRLALSLPNPHFASRSICFGALVLRAFCLDKALTYHKVVQTKTQTRASDNNAMVAVSSGRGRTTSSRGLGRSTSRGMGMDAEEVVVAKAPAGRGRRAAQQASEKISHMSRLTSEDTAPGQGEDDNDGDGDNDYFNEDDDEEDDDQDQDDEDDESMDQESASKSNDQDVYDRRDATTGASARGDWTCPACSTTNLPRSRSCTNCDTRKPPPGSNHMEEDEVGREARRGGRGRGRGSGRGGRGRGGRGGRGRGGRGRGRGGRRGRKRSREDNSDEDEDEDEDDNDEQEDEDEDREEDDDDEDEEERRGAKTTSRGRGRRSLRTTVASRSYREASSSSEVEPDGVVPAKRTRAASKWQEEEEEEFEGNNANHPHTGNGSSDLSLKPLLAILDEVKRANPSPASLPHRLATLLHELASDRGSFHDFFHPVDTTVHRTYTMYVDEPMDLGEIINRVRDDVYGPDGVEAAWKDLELVWSNAFSFYAQDSESYSSALRLKDKVLELWDSVVAP